MSTRRELLRRNDLRLIEFARSLSSADWQRPSLCTGWTNHEVLAHIVYGYQAPPVPMVTEMVRRSGSFDRANCALARQHARRRTPAELIGDLTALIDAPRGIGRVFPPQLLLGDHVIHELDIALAIGREPGVPAEALTAVLETQVRLPNPFIPARSRASGLTLHADDVGWRHGAGPRVTGSAAHLASVLAGRPQALAHLDGDGVATLGARL
ncbi:maleylpyruvate isomerase family mycothiol-dependent enzyme [Mycolicibacterium sphagni]|uniref:Maleylpyruvate isomerase family mycothiol-dependent enzyme n=1 Tax=Mycolicibacterium sphagni TaxID=1786 RepID=A0ABX2K111_9MYCO|nr:maleylpyruvate isomerase family mycothiol-dependent enzyme [Mycolicibacterium sphagni]NTY63340.1 maleylpyruvate isomerase family mycothiol-dependent enzyme [Mycolicibacterium sphagni]